MQFIFDGEMYKVIRITGPAHNILGLAFAENNSTVRDIEIMSLQAKIGEVISIDASEVKEQVLCAITEINTKFGANYRVMKIQFALSDTPIVNIYKELTMLLINRIIMKEKFIRI